MSFGQIRGSIAIYDIIFDHLAYPVVFLHTRDKEFRLVKLTNLTCTLMRRHLNLRKYGCKCTQNDKVTYCLSAISNGIS